METSWLPWWASWRHLEISWGSLGRSWEYFRAILDILEVSWEALCARIGQDVDRNPQNVKALKNQRKSNVFLGCRGSSGGLLAVFRAFLLALWRTLEDVLGVLGGVLEALKAPRRPKMVARRAKMDSNWQGERSERASERSERSDQDEFRRVDGKRCRGGTAG